VILHQPVDYAEAVARDAVQGFGVPVHEPGSNGRSTRWLFRPEFPAERGTFRMLHRYGYARGRSRPRLARFLRGYQGLAFVPGPLLAACLAVALLAVVGVGRARRSGIRTATFLLAALGLTVYVGAVATTTFTWRYRLPLIVLLPPAAALAASALSRPRRGAGSADTPARPSRTAGRRPSRRRP
jgi:hypothetical protein